MVVVHGHGAALYGKLVHASRAHGGGCLAAEDHLLGQPPVALLHLVRAVVEARHVHRLCEARLQCLVNTVHALRDGARGVEPVAEILQVLGSRFEITRVGRMIQALMIFVYGILTSQVEWTFARILTVVFMLLGGCALFSGLFMIYATLCFFTLEGLEFMNVLTDGGREYGKYPIDVYGKRMLQFATVIIPYTLVQYYPLQYLLGRTESMFYMFLPLVTIFFLIPCWLFSRFGVRKYKSSGS